MKEIRIYKNDKGEFCAELCSEGTEGKVIVHDSFSSSSYHEVIKFMHNLWQYL